MQLIRLSQNNFSITCCGYTFIVIKRSFSDRWYAECKDLHIHQLFDDLAEVFDYIDFLFS